MKISVIIFAIFLALVERITFLSISIKHLPTNTDEALGILLAREIWRGARPIFLSAQPYQFPLESYLMAPIAELLPGDAFGARILPALFAIPAFIGFILVLNKSFKRENRLLALLLILFPSSYLLIRESAFYTPIQVSTLTFAWLIPLCFLYFKEKNSHWGFNALTGFLSGLALSCYLVSISIVFMVGIAICLGKNFKTALNNSAIYIGSFLLGFSPYLYAYFFVAGSHADVTKTYKFFRAIKRIWTPTITDMLPATFGVTRTNFPDIDYYTHFITHIKHAHSFAYCFILLIIIATFYSLKNLYLRFKKERWLSLTMGDIFLGAIIISIISFAFAKFDTKPRYLLPVVWFFPFLIAFIYSHANRFLKTALSLVVVFYVGWNIRSSYEVMQFWNKPNQVAELADLPRVNSIINKLKANDIKHCYSYWWLVYRINFESDEQILCEQFINQRFPNWSLPYEVEVSKDKPSFLYYTGAINRRASFQAFKKKLEERNIRHSIVGTDRFKLFTGFDNSDVQKIFEFLRR